MSGRAMDTGWFTSSYSNGGGDDCVECRLTDAGTSVRDSKDPAGGTFRVGPEAWAAFIATARA